MQSIYLQKYNPDPLDYLSNAEYKKLHAEKRYTAVLYLIKYLPQPVIQFVLEYIREKIDLSARTLRRIKKSIDNGMFADFKYIYDEEYMSPTIVDFFEYGEESQEHRWQFYTLCKCRSCGCIEKDEFCYDCEPERFCKYCYIKGCTCQDGKRYLAFWMIYSVSHEIIKIQKKKKQKRPHQYQLMIDHVIESGPLNAEGTKGIIF